MTDMETTHTQAPGVLVVGKRGSPADCARARDVTRTWPEALDPTPACEAAQTLALLASELATNAPATAAAATSSVLAPLPMRCTSLSAAPAPHSRVRRIPGTRRLGR